LNRPSPAAGRRFVAACFKRVESLAQFPRQGRMTPEAQREDIRELIVEDHCLIYWTDGERVRVLAVSRMLVILPTFQKIRMAALPPKIIHPGGPPNSNAGLDKP